MANTAKRVFSLHFCFGRQCVLCVIVNACGEGILLFHIEHEQPSGRAETAACGSDGLRIRRREGGGEIIEAEKTRMGKKIQACSSVGRPVPPQRSER